MVGAGPGGTADRCMAEVYVEREEEVKKEWARKEGVPGVLGGGGEEQLLSEVFLSAGLRVRLRYSVYVI